MRVSVVIPVYNSEAILPRLVARLHEVLGRLSADHEVILVNDCSTDGSWHVIRGLCEKYDKVRAINLRRNTGQHNAIMAGLGFARGETVVLMDDDLQHLPDDVARLVGEIEKGFDVCYGTYRQSSHVWWKRLGSRFNGAMAEVLLKKPKGLYLSPFKAISAGVKDEVIKYTGPYSYIDGLILMTTNNITSVAVDHHRRSEGAGNYSLRRSIRLWLQMATSFSVLPLRISGVIGITLALLGLLFAVAVVVLRIFAESEIPLGWSSLITVLLVIGGAQLVALSLLGEYLGRAYVKLNNVPQFAIRETLNASLAKPACPRSRSENSNDGEVR